MITCFTCQARLRPQKDTACSVSHDWCFNQGIGSVTVIQAMYLVRVLLVIVTWQPCTPSIVNPFTSSVLLLVTTVIV